MRRPLLRRTRGVTRRTRLMWKKPYYPVQGAAVGMADDSSTGAGLETQGAAAAAAGHAPEERDAGASERVRKITSGIRSLTIQNAVNSIMGFVFLTLLLRLLSPSDYGLYSAALVVTGIGSSIASFGLQSAATRFVAFLGRDEGESRLVSRSIVVLALTFST